MSLAAEQYTLTFSLVPCTPRAAPRLVQRARREALRCASNLGDRTSAGPSSSKRRSLTRSARTSLARFHGASMIRCWGWNLVLTPKACCAISRAASSLSARIMAAPRCELASQLGSTKSTGVKCQIAIFVSLHFRSKPSSQAGTKPVSIRPIASALNQCVAARDEALFFVFVLSLQRRLDAPVHSRWMALESVDAGQGMQLRLGQPAILHSTRDTQLGWVELPGAQNEVTALWSALNGTYEGS